MTWKVDLIKRLLNIKESDSLSRDYLKKVLLVNGPTGLYEYWDFHSRNNGNHICAAAITAALNGETSILLVKDKERAGNIINVVKHYITVLLSLGMKMDEGVILQRISLRVAEGEYDNIFIDKEVSLKCEM